MPRQPASRLPYSLRLNSLRRAPLRPRDLVVKPDPRHEPSSPAELFVAALLDGHLLGVDALLPKDVQHHIKIKVHVQEIRGAVEGCFQDASTWKLHMTLEPNLYIRRLSVVLAEFTGCEFESKAPTWLTRLGGDGPESMTEYVRPYEWVFRSVFRVIILPRSKVPAAHAWIETFNWIYHIKKLCDKLPPRPAGIPTPPVPRPRLRRAENVLVDAMQRLRVDDNIANGLQALGVVLAGQLEVARSGGEWGKESVEAMRRVRVVERTTVDWRVLRTVVIGRVEVAQLD